MVVVAALVAAGVVVLVATSGRELDRRVEPAAVSAADRSECGLPATHLGTAVAGAEVALMNETDDVTATAEASGRFAIEIAVDGWWKIHGSADASVGVGSC